MKITRPEHNYSILIREDDTLYLAVKAEDEIVELEGMKGYLYYYSECVDEEDIEASPKLTLKEMQDYTKEVLNEWNISADAIEALISDLTSWFEKYAVSEKEKAEDKIRELEERIAFRRNGIMRKMRDIEEENKRIIEMRKRIDAYAKEAAELDADIRAYEKTIAELKASLRGEKFVSVDPEYTGGGIYLFTGKLADGNFFMADTANYDVRILTEDPNEPIGEDRLGITERNIDSVEWQEEHLVKDLVPDEAVAFFKEMLKWVEDNDPSGNYLGADMDYFKNELETLKGDWR